MKSALGFGLIAALGALGSLGVASDAHALQLNHHGAICQPYNSTEVADIDYLVYGTRNVNANARYVICPLVHSPYTADYSFAAYVMIKHNAAVTTSCTLYSYNYNGALIASSSFSVAGTGTFARLVTLAANTAPTYSKQALLCSLPGSGNSVIVDIDVMR